MRVSKWAKLKKSQAELDFIDVDTSRDTKLFVDPYAIEIKQDKWSKECANHLRSYFGALIDAIRTKNNDRALHLVSQLHEAEETFLGFSKGEPRGSGLGPMQSQQLLRALARSGAVKSGLLSELSESELYIDGIGPDKVSDLTTNVIRGPLIRYTHEQAALWGMKLTPNLTVGPVWNPTTEDWVQDYRSLPVVGGKPVILVPKYSVRRQIALNSQEFYNHHMTSFLQAEYLKSGGSLVRTLRSGERHVYKKDVREKHPKSKEAIGEFVREHPHVLEAYKKLRGADGVPSAEEIDEKFSHSEFSDHLIEELAKIPAGANDASSYHLFCLGALTYLFHPKLINPVKEREINEGRKRIDISYTNAALPGFFMTVLQNASTRAIEIPVECKNYSTDINNPELDQICGRFAHTRGFFGIICCRKFDNKSKFLKRCKDAAKERGHFVLVLDDLVIKEMLHHAGQRAISRIDQLLQNQFALLIS